MLGRNSCFQTCLVRDVKKVEKQWPKLLNCKNQNLKNLDVLLLRLTDTGKIPKYALILVDSDALFLMFDKRIAVI